jgi:hypothetical protein
VNQLPSNLFEKMLPDLAEELGIDRAFDTGASILVVTGKNAAGKSLLRRWIQVAMKRHHDNTEVIHLSQQGRAMEGIGRAFIYGSEDDESTGAISCNTFIGGMRTMIGREKPHAVIWDEPEIGMGEELQMGTADWLCEQLEDWPKQTLGVVLLTHSHHFVRRAMQFPGVKWLSMDGYATADEWLNRDIVPIGPEEVRDMGHERWSRVSKILKKRRDDVKA